MKNNQIHEKILKVTSVLLICIILFNVFINIFYWNDSWTEFLWYCNFSAILFSLGILFRKKYLISGVLITAIPAQFFWILDFSLRLIGLEGFGRTAWLSSLPILTIFPSIIVHIALIPLAFYAVRIYGFDKKGFFVALAILLFSTVAPFYLSAEDDNINCVFYSCDVKFEYSATYTLLGIPSYSLEYLGFIMFRWFIIEIIIYLFLLNIFRNFFKKVIIS